MYNFKLYHNKHAPATTAFQPASKTVSLFTKPYLDTCHQCYKTIVIVNMQPIGPLASITKFIKFTPLSEFEEPSSCNPLKKCGYALLSLEHPDTLMEANEIPTLMSFLLSNGYTINTSLTKMFNTSEITFDTNNSHKLICFVTYDK